MIDCKKLANEVKEVCKKKLAGITEPYYLKIIQVEGDAASDAYTKGKKQDCVEIGLQYRHVIIPKNCDMLDVSLEISKGNHDAHCIGIILQLPLPEHLREYQELFTKLIKEEKDVDGFRPDSSFYPCTPLGINHILHSVTNHNISGLHCVIVGRGKLVGYPTFELLNEENATVTLCNSRTPKEKLKELCLSADVVIAATGVPNLITKDMVKPTTIVIDAGINRDENGKMCGDCSRELYDYVENITTVPGGVGLMTRAALMRNCVMAIEEKELPDVDN